MASTKTPAKRAPKPKPDEEFDDLTDVVHSDDGESFTAEIFGSGEVFVFSTDVNAFLLMNASRDLAGGAFLDLMDSLVLLPEGDDADEERRKERDRFHGVLGSTKHLSVERLAKFVAAITDAAGNDDSETSLND